MFDPSLVQWGDLSSNCFLRGDQVGSISRSAACLEQLQKLNPYVKINAIHNLTLEDHLQYNVVCYTELLGGINQIMEVNDFVRSKNIAFLFSATFGPCGFAFVDFGDTFLVKDKEGEDNP